MKLAKSMPGLPELTSVLCSMLNFKMKPGSQPRLKLVLRNKRKREYGIYAGLKANICCL